MYNKTTAVATSSSSSGIGFGGLLTLLFVAAKLFGFITWSWFWVLSPLWIGAILWVLFVAAVIGIAVWSEK